MGSIKFYGIRSDYETISYQELSQVEVPENAHIIKDYTEINMENSLFFTLPITIIIMIIIIIKQLKSGFLNKNVQKEIKEERIKKHKLDSNKKIIIFMLKMFFAIYISIFAFMSII